LWLKLARRTLALEFIAWNKNRYRLPAPSYIKTATLARNCIQGDWIETGTYLGETSMYFAKKFKGSKVITIEPSESLQKFSAKRLEKFNVVCLLGSSEEALPIAIDIAGKNLNFWLDGHFSGDVTFQGKKLSPIVEELEIIQKRLTDINNVCIFIDDVRLFSGENEISYPEKAEIIKWCDRNNFSWDIEYDIFILKRHLRDD
jgi:hypothetical protein